MHANDLVILGWARSPVAPRGGAFKALRPHEIAAPVVLALLDRFGIAPDCIDAVVAGNALGAGGNPARMLGLAASLPDRCAAYSIDTQCCAGLDAVAMAAGLLASGSASIVLAGGVEAWSRAPIRQHRPLRKDDLPQAYERPAFAPDPARDPDMLLSAARYAARQGYSRLRQDAYAILSHTRALAASNELADEIVPIAGLAGDAYPRGIRAERAARMPAAAISDCLFADAATAPAARADCSLSPLAISPKADGAAFVVLATRAAAERLSLTARARWLGGASLGARPETPLLAAIDASRAVLVRAHIAIDSLAAIELHDAFAVQALSFCDAFSIDTARLNRRGGGLARGHPIGASAAIALVRLLADLDRDAPPGARGLTAVAGAGGIGSAAIVERC